MLVSPSLEERDWKIVVQGHSRHSTLFQKQTGCSAAHLKSTALEVEEGGSVRGQPGQNHDILSEKILKQKGLESDSSGGAPA
jgi:hypothetical protein